MGEAVIIGGVRTPFVKAAGQLKDTPAPELGRLVVRELIERYDLDPNDVDELITGNVASPVDAANVSRVIALRAGIPRSKIAHTVSRNCASGLESITQAIDRIELGHAHCVIAVGVDSMSNVPVFWSKQFAEKLFKMSTARGSFGKLKALLKIRPKDLAPQIGLKLGLTDPVIGMMMGDTAEKLARELNISREEQDEFALQSHQKAVAALEAGRLSDETMTIYPEPSSDAIGQDVGPRKEQSIEALAKMKPYFDRRWGSITIGNACGVTDGAAAMLIMAADKAAALGLEPIGRLRSSAFAGCDPERMGIGPVYSTALALQRAGMKLDDMDLIELNEAFAAQVLACTRLFEQPPDRCIDEDAASRLSAVDPDRLNVNGGAIALGHPVGATGTRLVLTLLGELRRRNQSHGLATMCIGGGQGGTAIVENFQKAA